LSRYSPRVPRSSSSLPRSSFGSPKSSSAASPASTRLPWASPSQGLRVQGASAALHRGWAPLRPPSFTEIAARLPAGRYGRAAAAWGLSSATGLQPGFDRPWWVGPHAGSWRDTARAPPLRRSSGSRNSETCCCSVTPGCRGLSATPCGCAGHWVASPVAAVFPATYGSHPRGSGHAAGPDDASASGHASNAASGCRQEA
jgi:hypothetical protein